MLPSSSLYTIFRRIRPVLRIRLATDIACRAWYVITLLRRSPTSTQTLCCPYILVSPSVFVRLIFGDCQSVTPRNHHNAFITDSKIVNYTRGPALIPRLEVPKVRVRTTDEWYVAPYFDLPLIIEAIRFDSQTLYTSFIYDMVSLCSVHLVCAPLFPLNVC